MKEPELKTELGDIELKNPVITASGTCGFGVELKDFTELSALGAITVKGITPEPSQGNPTPRIAETAAGILNSIGLENPGIDNFLAEKIEDISQLEPPVFVNIAGHSVSDFVYLARRLAPFQQIAAVELNVSCPNLQSDGSIFGSEAELVYEVTGKVKEVYSGPVIVKLSPNVTDIVEMARAAEKGGADAISLINTLLGMAIDADSQKPVLGNIFGGLSGPAIKPVALRMVYQVAKEVDVPLIGMGGIMTGQDAVEFLLAGASAVAVGTATLTDPGAALEILGGIKDYMRNKGINHLSDLIGCLD